MYTYIVVDDEPLTRKGILKKLESFAGDISCIGEASNGEEGLTLVKNVHPDIIITDMNMPGTDGGMFLVNIRDILPDIPIIVISGYKDFEYAHKAIEYNACKYILKPFPKEEIHQAMNIAIRSIEEHKKNADYIIKISEEQESIKYEYDVQTLKSLLLGYQSGIGRFHSTKFITLHRESRIYYMLLLYSDHVLPAATMQDFITENDMNYFCIYVPNLQNESLGALLLSFEEQHENRIQPYVRNISHSLIQYFADQDIALRIGISSAGQSLELSHIAYREACDALNSTTHADNEHYFFYSGTEPQIRPITWSMEEIFLFRVETAEKDAVNKLICSLFDEYAKDTTLTLRDMKYYCLHLINQGRQILNDYIKVNSSVDSNNAKTILENIFSFDELQNYVTLFFSNIRNMLEKNNKYASSDVVDQIMMYTEKKYYNDLNLDFLSSLFYLNRSYISHLFKKNTGLTYSSYLTQLRISKAIELLEKTDKKPYQIAKAVGYDNSKYFFRIFKKETGYTPEEYRETHRAPLS
ncbi:MAG: response regulator [Lachnospiraceae bacterium]|nr:response regulator [Lachnospiraceae bacterium]